MSARLPSTEGSLGLQGLPTHKASDLLPCGHLLGWLLASQGAATRGQSCDAFRSAVPGVTYHCCGLILLVSLASSGRCGGTARARPPGGGIQPHLQVCCQVCVFCL